MGTYVSKFTGAEIDTNLDKIKDIAEVASTEYVNSLVGNLETVLSNLDSGNGVE